VYDDSRAEKSRAQGETCAPGRGGKNTENLRARYIKHEPARLKSKIFARAEQPSPVLARAPFVFDGAPGGVGAFLRFGARERVAGRREGRAGRDARGASAYLLRRLLGV
jgi:hypothetical protein